MNSCGGGNPWAGRRRLTMQCPQEDSDIEYRIRTPIESGHPGYVDDLVGAGNPWAGRRRLTMQCPQEDSEAG